MATWQYFKLTCRPLSGRNGGWVPKWLKTLLSQLPAFPAKSSRWLFGLEGRCHHLLPSMHRHRPRRQNKNHQALAHLKKLLVWKILPASAWWTIKPFAHFLHDYTYFRKKGFLCVRMCGFKKVGGKYIRTYTMLCNLFCQCVCPLLVGSGKLHCCRCERNCNFWQGKKVVCCTGSI